MEKINVLIGWSGDNYCATLSEKEIDGCVIVTHKTLEDVKKNFVEALKFHVEGIIHDGGTVPKILKQGEYELDFTMDTSALLHNLDGILTRSAISRVTGINERQLGHYASGHRKPRPEQRLKIINGIHSIGKDLTSVV